MLGAPVIKMKAEKPARLNTCMYAVEYPGPIFLDANRERKSVVPQNRAASSPKMAGGIRVGTLASVTSNYPERINFAFVYGKLILDRYSKKKLKELPKLRFGFQFPNVMGYSPFDRLRKIAETAEDLGFDSIWTS